MDEIYNKHYIKTRADGAIIDAFSDGPNPENPSLCDMDGIPLYKWDGQAVQHRMEAEIAADRAAIPAPPLSEMELLRQEVARLSAENAQMKQGQTNIEMALCETYELLLGGNDNG